MGSVWRATRMDLGTEIAVKIMHGDASQKTGALGRFEREAKAAASLSSPHVVRIIDFGIDPATAHAFLAMELLIGESLAERLKGSPHLPPALVARVINQVGRALNQAHGLGIVHRDLKPANVFLVHNEDEDLVKLLDFGIAKADGSFDEALLTETGNVLGTPHYMSPEQLRSSKAVDHRADLWSLAVIACECLTGQRPFRGDSLGELAMRISLGRCEPPSSLGPVPVGFDEWFARATEVDPARRFQTAAELSSALTAVVVSSQGREQLPTVSPALDLTLAADEPVARRVLSEAPVTSTAAVAQPASATLSTANMSSVLATSDTAARGRAGPRHPRARWLWLAAGVVATGGAAAVTLRYSGGGAASIRSEAPPKTLASTQPDPGPALPQPEASPPLLPLGASARTSDALPGPTVSTPEVATARAPRSAEARATLSTSAGSAPSAAAAATQHPRTAIGAPPRRNRTPSGERGPGTRVTPKEHLDAYDWQ
jgi:serine/threonine protein kinase